MDKITIQPQGFLVPLPATMLSCRIPGERPNIITLSWVGVLCSEPPVIGVGIRPSRFSHHIVKETGEFVLNLPSETQVEQTDYCGHKSGRSHDKFEVCGFTPKKGLRVSAPVIVECPVNIECRVMKSLLIGSHELFLGEILAIQIDKSCLDSEGKVEITRVKPFVYVPTARVYAGGIDTILGKSGSLIRPK